VEERRAAGLGQAACHAGDGAPVGCKVVAVSAVQLQINESRHDVALAEMIGVGIESVLHARDRSALDPECGFGEVI